MKIGVIGDIHIGKSKDATVKMNAITAAIDWAKEEFSKRNVTDVVVLGDIHDNRNAVSLTSLGNSFSLIESLAKSFNVVILAGNHDTAVKAGCSQTLHSLHQFLYMPNVKVAVTDKISLIDGNKTVTIVPWGYSLEEFKTVKTDVLMGHFEYSGAALSSGVSTGDISMKELSELAPLVMSGHYHIREDRMIDGHRFISVGSLTELDWGDAGTSKGVYILDTQTMTSEFIECLLKPKHVYLSLRKLKDKTQAITKDVISGNYVKLAIDIKMKYDMVKKLTTAINALNPIVPCIPEFQQTMTLEKADNKPMQHTASNDKRQYMLDYVDNIDSKMLSKSTVDDVKTALTEYYNSAIEKVG